MAGPSLDIELDTVVVGIERLFLDGEGSGCGFVAGDDEGLKFRTSLLPRELEPLLVFDLVSLRFCSSA